MALALYREYRPKSFDEVCGQEHIVKILKNEVNDNNLSHAYLFVGPRGTGKTTCAKLLAKAANCEHPIDGNPCGKCESCLSFDEGNHLDITEIDAASNNGVDDIRNLRDEVTFSPNKSKYRVYIIDEVHMLSQSAFNALLKTLEEPPEYVIFILATTEIYKVLPTVISRCQRFDFKRIDEKVIADRLKFISSQEGIEIEDEAATLIARLSDGGMRDAVSLLDVCSADSKNVTEELVSKTSGLTGCGHLIDLCDCIIDKKPGDMLSKAEECFTRGLTPQRLCRDMIIHLRNLMMIKTVAKPWEMIKCMAFEQEMLKHQAERMPMSQLLYCIDHFQNCSADMSRGIDAKTALETSFLVISDENRSEDTHSLIKRIERLEDLIFKLQSERQDEEEERPSKSKQEVKAKPQVPAIEKAVEKESYEDEFPHEKYETAPVKKETPKIQPQAQKLMEVTVFSKWESVLSELEVQNSSIYNMLTGTKAYFNGKHVLIDVSNPLLLKMLKDNEFTKTSIKKAIFTVTGKSYPIGPYRSEKSIVVEIDPLEDFINKNSDNENFNIR